MGWHLEWILETLLSVLTLQMVNITCFYNLYLTTSNKILFSKGKTRKIYFQFLSDCTCKDLMNPFGYGNCASTGFSSEFCYVNQPTSCSDALDSLDLPGEKISSEPCKGRKSHLILTKLNVSSVEVFYVICE